MEMAPSQILEKVINKRSQQTDKESGTEPEEDGDAMFEGVMPFILQTLPAAISVITADHQYDRVALLKKLLSRTTGNALCIQTTNF